MAGEGKEKNSVEYIDEDGNKLIRYWKRYEGEPVEKVSTRSWRNNNPGNLKIGPFARRNGAIGEAGLPVDPEDKVKFAVFPDFDTGRKAQAKRLREGDMYIDLTLHELPRKYLGVKKGIPDPEKVIEYRKSIKQYSGLDMQRTIRSLNDEEYEKLLYAMTTHEGWREGREESIEVKNILNVRLNSKKVITEFLIGNAFESVWLLKSDAIDLAEKGKLHAVVVHSKCGTYLRPEHRRTSFRQLACVAV